MVALKLILASCVLMAVVSADFSDLFEGRAINQKLLAAAEPNTACTDENLGKACKDCKTAIQCNKFGTSWYAAKETTCGGNTPWCREGACSANQTNSCNQPSTSTSFQCTSEGYFPDMKSCTKYYLCVGTTAYSYDCNAYPNTVYDHTKKLCVPRRQSTCFTLRCPNPNNVIYQYYTPAPWVYASCTDNDAANALVGTCDEGQAWNGLSCARSCQTAGRFPDTAKGVNAFYECVDLGGGKFSEPQEGECPEGTTFNAEKEVCEISSNQQPQPTPTP